MNRTYKFRAWDKHFKEMVTHINAQDDQNVLDLGEGEGKKYVLMQFTGLLDKKGKEIYEGDLLWEDNSWDRNDDDSMGFYTYQIKWDEETAGFEIYDLEEGDVFVPTNGDPLREFINGDRLKTFEVIGNVYESPDLLNNNLKI